MKKQKRNQNLRQCDNYRTSKAKKTILLLKNRFFSLHWLTSDGYILLEVHPEKQMYTNEPFGLLYQHNHNHKYPKVNKDATHSLIRFLKQVHHAWGRIAFKQTKKYVPHGVLEMQALE